MKHALPRTDSTQELADFWDAHDLTDLDDELVEVPSPFAVRDRSAVVVPLSDDEHKIVQRIAEARGVQEGALIHEWVKEHIERR